MQKRVDLLTYICILFIILLIVSGMLDGVISTITYILAFALPVFLGVKFGAEREEDSDYLGLSKKNSAFVLPFVFPLVALIFLISYLTSLVLLATLGKTNTVDIGDNPLLAFLEHALVPAVLEEALFRYVPLRMLGKRSPRLALVFSSLYFALAHHSFFSIPYALVAGFAFMMLDLAADSILPSLILHFINNCISIIWILYSDSSVFVTVFLILLSVLTLVSLVIIFFRRREYRERFLPVFAEGEKYKITLTPLFLIIPALMLAVAELI